MQFVGEGHQAPNLLTTTPTYTHNIEVASPMLESFAAGMIQAMPTAAAGSGEGRRGPTTVKFAGDGMAAQFLRGVQGVA